MAAARQVLPETLDHLDAQDPAAIRSRLDLRRIHRWMGTRATVTRAWQGLLPAAQPAGPLRLLELGAGDGSLMLAVARRLAPAWPDVELTLMDRQPVVDRATLAAYARLGWRVSHCTCDALDWAADAGTAAAAPRWDLAIANLFLHHFEGAHLRSLLAAIAARADRVIAVEPRRTGLALWASRAVGLIGANAVTRADAVLSVRAGFRGRELSVAWPGATSGWQLAEARAGLFSHCLVGQAERSLT